jgi:hypothetical protein
MHKSINNEIEKLPLFINASHRSRPDSVNKLIMCTKSRFSSRALALQRLAEIQTKGEVREKKPARVYFCNECGGYHLTSAALTKKQQSKLLKEKNATVRHIANEWAIRKGWNEDSG